MNLMKKKQKNTNLKVHKITMKKLKKQVKGITLIALVVTVIVLLILAGVAISLTVGDNGLFRRAQNAKEETEKSEIIENIRLDIAAVEIENMGEISKNQYIDILEKYGYIENDGSILRTKKGNYAINISDIYLLDINIIDVTPVYATLYNNGYLVFNTNESIYSGVEESNILVQTEDISNKSFESTSDVP